MCTCISRVQLYSYERKVWETKKNLAAHRRRLFYVDAYNCISHETHAYTEIQALLCKRPQYTHTHTQTHIYTLFHWVICIDRFAWGPTIVYRAYGREHIANYDSILSQCDMPVQPANSRIFELWYMLKLKWEVNRIIRKTNNPIAENGQRRNLNAHISRKLFLFDFLSFGCCCWCCFHLYSCKTVASWILSLTYIRVHIFLSLSQMNAMCVLAAV